MASMTFERNAAEGKFSRVREINPDRHHMDLDTLNAEATAFNLN